MAVLANGSTRAQHSVHINHGALAYNRADIDHGAHHDHSVFVNVRALADKGAWLDAGVHLG